MSVKALSVRNRGGGSWAPRCPGCTAPKQCLAAVDSTHVPDSLSGETDGWGSRRAPPPSPCPPGLPCLLRHRPPTRPRPLVGLGTGAGGPRAEGRRPRDGRALGRPCQPPAMGALPRRTTRTSLRTLAGDAPVTRTPRRFRERAPPWPTWRSLAGHTRRSFASRWWRWPARGGRRTRWHGSSCPRPGRPAHGCAARHQRGVPGRRAETPGETQWPLAPQGHEERSHQAGEPGASGGLVRAGGGASIPRRGSAALEEVVRVSRP